MYYLCDKEKQVDGYVTSYNVSREDAFRLPAARACSVKIFLQPKRREAEEEGGNGHFLARQSSVTPRKLIEYCNGAISTGIIARH